MALACSGDKKEPETTRGPGVTQGNVLSPDSVRIHYDIRGEGSPALVFVHCWSCDRTYWENQVEEFSKDYTVVTIDLAGHGESGQNRENWSIKYYAQDVAAVINKLCLEDVILIGHSMGGPVNLYAASLLEGKVKALIGADTYLSFTASYSPRQIEDFMKSFKLNFESATTAFVVGMFPQTADSMLVREISADMASAPPEIAIESLENLFQFMFGGGLTMIISELDIPIRTIVTDRNPLDLEGNKALVPTFDAKVMTGVGHFLIRENPEEFNRLFHETLNELLGKEDIAASQ
jgi:pimeloyl-ACP methyl ester carboxylesterase